MDSLYSMGWGLSKYNILRSIGNEINFSPITSVAPMVPYAVTDNVAKFDLASGSFYYRVEAVEDVNNALQFQFSDNSLSNVAEAIQEPEYFIPNAFFPDGVNKTFVPVGVFNNENDYYFGIFSRMGGLVFETLTPNKGWDGTYKGSDATQGVYVYVLKYTDSDGHRYHKIGTVTLLR